MKKMIGIIMAVVFIFTLSACGKNTKPTATIENFEVGRSTCSFDLKINDTDKVAEGTVMAKFYEIGAKEDVFISTRTIAAYEGKISISGLTSDKEHRVDILCTYNKAKRIIETKFFETTVAGTEEDPIVLNTASELVEKFGSEYGADVYYELGADIDFAEIKDFGGFCKTNANAFSANLDGKNHVIKNVTITSDETYVGFFGYVKGVIEDVKFENMTINVNRTSTAQAFVGSVAGYGYQAKLLNVDVDGITITSTTAGLQYAAGLVGYAFGTNVIDCDVEDLALSITKSTNTYVGGITAYVCQNSASNYGKINNCTATGTISAVEVGNTYYGGIVGYAKSGTHIHNAIANVEATIKSNQKACLGGIAGYANNGADFEGYIDNVSDLVATGKIIYQGNGSTSDVMIGGLFGAATAIQINNAYVGVDMIIDIDTKTALYVGAIFGNAYEYHSGAKNVLINSTMSFTTVTYPTLHINEYDGTEVANIIDAKVINLVAKKDESNELFNASPKVEISQNTIDNMGWDLDFWDAKIVEGKLVFNFK